MNYVIITVQAKRESKNRRNFYGNTSQVIRTNGVITLAGGSQKAKIKRTHVVKYDAVL